MRPGNTNRQGGCLADMRYEPLAFNHHPPPLATQITKAGLYQGMNADLTTQLRWEKLAGNYLGETEDFTEAARAFVEKRDPVFKGR